MAIDVRPATEDDVGDMQHVAERTWYDAHAPIIGEETTAEFLDEYYDADSLRAVLDRSGWITVVADEGRAVGFISGGPDEDDTDLFYLNRVYVLPERYGEGIGGRLLERFEHRVSERDGDRIRLRVMAENDQAVGFYDSAGYDRREKIYDDAVGTHSYVYTKEL